MLRGRVPFVTLMSAQATKMNLEVSTAMIHPEAPRPMLPQQAQNGRAHPGLLLAILPGPPPLTRAMEVSQFITS